MSNLIHFHSYADLAEFSLGGSLGRYKAVKAAVDEPGWMVAARLRRRGEVAKESKGLATYDGKAIDRIGPLKLKGRVKSAINKVRDTLEPVPVTKYGTGVGLRIADKTDRLITDTRRRYLVRKRISG